MMDFTVDMKDLRRALRATVPHIYTGDVSVPELERIRIEVDTDVATVCATDRFSVGMAVVSVIAHHHPEPMGPTLGSLDLTPSDVTKILHLFKGGSPSQQWLLRIDTTSESDIVFTDVSGMISGDSLRLRRTPVDDEFPDLQQRMSNWLDSPPDLLEGFDIEGEMIARFKVAATIYKQPLELSAHAGTGAMIVRCEESFLGAVFPSYPDEDTELARKRWAEAWNNRLPAPDHEIPDRTGTGEQKDLLRNGSGVYTAAPEEIPVEVLVEATRLVINTQFAAQSFLQRRLNVGFARSRDILDQLAEHGVVSRDDGHTAREVLLTVGDVDLACARIRAAAGSDQNTADTDGGDSDE